MLRQRAQQRRPYAAPPGRREDARREKTLPREVGTAGDSRTGKLAVQLGEQEDGAGCGGAADLSTLPQRSFGMTVVRTCRYAPRSLSVCAGRTTIMARAEGRPAAPLDGLRGEPKVVYRAALSASSQYASGAEAARLAQADERERSADPTAALVSTTTTCPNRMTPLRKNAVPSPTGSLPRRATQRRTGSGRRPCPSQMPAPRATWTQSSRARP